MSEMRNPARTIRLAGLIAIAVVTLLYLLTNFAYLSGISKSEILGSGRLIAAILARNVWGPVGERFVCVAVALSALGNVLSVVSIFDSQNIIVTHVHTVFRARSGQSGART